MLSSSEAQYTGLALTAHVRADCSGNIRKTIKKNMDLDSVLEDVLRSRGQGNVTLKPRQKEALQSIVFFNWLRQVVDLPNATITV